MACLLLSLRQSNGNGSPNTGGAVYCQSGAAHLRKAGTHIGQPHMGMAGVLTGWVKADAVIAHYDYVPSRGHFSCADPDGAALIPLAQAVLDCIFHQRLQGQRGDAEVLILYVIDHIYTVTEAFFLDGKIAPNVFQLSGKGDGFPLAEGVQIAPQIPREFAYCLLGGGRVDGTESLYRSQRIVNKMRRDLRQHQRNAQVGGLLFSLRQLAILLHHSGYKHQDHGKADGQVDKRNAIVKQLHSGCQKRQGNIGQHGHKRHAADVSPVLNQQQRIQQHPAQGQQE